LELLNGFGNELFPSGVTKFPSNNVGPELVFSTLTLFLSDVFEGLLDPGGNSSNVYAYLSIARTLLCLTSSAKVT